MTKFTHFLKRRLNLSKILKMN